MAQPKKRPSKKAKAAQRILKNSKLLEIAKTNNDSKDDEVFEPDGAQIKTSGANKLKPHKKRG